jgi:phosphopantetheine adenylyltransferase
MAKEILEYVLIPLLIILTRYLIVFIDAKRKELKEKTNNELANKYIDMIYNTVTNCVIATNQTYVDSLKEQGNFDKEAQLEAFNKTLSAIKKMLSEDAVEYIHSITDDADFYLSQLIEAAVKD